MDAIVYSGSYYRLRQVDFDGAYEYFPTIYISSSSVLDAQVIIYPNPTQGVIHFGGGKDRIFDVSITDLSGKSILKTSNSTLVEAEKFLNLFLPSFDSGVYLISLNSMEYSAIIKLVLN